MADSSFSEKRFIATMNAYPHAYDAAKVGKSGGDNILYESLGAWNRKKIFSSIEMISCSSGARVIPHFLETRNIRLREFPTPAWLYSILPLLFTWKVLAATCLLFRLRPGKETILFSSSDIFPDTVPAFLTKLFFPKTKWVAAFYFFAPKPGSPEWSYRGLAGNLRGLFYFLSQKVCYRLIRFGADRVLACNEIDRLRFIKDGYPADRIHSIYGGVRLSEAEAVPEPAEKKLHAVFMARFHPQKGPKEAVEIWRRVVDRIPSASLGMIGNGPEEESVKKAIASLGLEANIRLFGFRDGADKYAILKSARLFLHPALYETGGMAAAEGMAAGLPVIAFDHPGFDYCYPKGILRIEPVGDLEKMADAVVSLLKHEDRYRSLRAEAQ
ncbi:MAG: glycosyltransferase, partial [Spirochaetia bacterium]|nr:glycosyltransferase [Spirochaetia bacterium]